MRSEYKHSLTWAAQEAPYLIQPLTDAALAISTCRHLGRLLIADFRRGETD